MKTKKRAPAAKPKAAPKADPKENPERKGGFALTIGVKLVTLVAFLLIGSIAAVVALSNYTFTDYTTTNIQQASAEKAQALSLQVREQLDSLNEKLRVMGSLLVQQQAALESVKSSGSKDLGEQRRVAEITETLNEYFQKDSDFVGLYVFRKEPSGAMKPVNFSLSPAYRIGGDADGSKAYFALTSNTEFSPSEVSQGDYQITTLLLPNGDGEPKPAIAVSVPFITMPGTKPEDKKFSHTLTGIVYQSKYSKIFGQSQTMAAYLVDRKGRLLAHSDSSRAPGESLSGVEIVRIFLEGRDANKQTRFTDPKTGAAKIGAFYTVGFAGLGVVAEEEEAKVFEAAEKSARFALYFALIILSVALLFGYVFSETIARPIRGLVEAARRISEGDFKIELRTRGRDEVGRLSRAFNEMARGLEERDKVKATFNKFHNKEIADKLLSGEVKLGGERKEATIFFSDVRGFTAMSESMDPAEVVEMLNEYMTRMVAIIRAHGGVVDKYVGDAIMALWGVPIGHPDDTLNAVKACIEMRKALAELNQLRLSRGQNELKIGMGLNHGTVIAGNIGSNEKMEYTVIGDAVNTASRMESMTKEYGTDLLIPKTVADRVAGRFILDRAKDARVKGKSEALQVFKVKGYIDADGKQIVIETPYSSYASEKSDKAVHDPSEEKAETKIEHEMPSASLKRPVASGPVPSPSQPVPSGRTRPAPTVAPAVAPSVTQADATPPPVVAAPPLSSKGEVRGAHTHPQVKPAGRHPGERTLTNLTIQTPPRESSAADSKAPQLPGEATQVAKAAEPTRVAPAPERERLARPKLGRNFLEDLGPPPVLERTTVDATQMVSEEATRILPVESEEATRPGASPSTRKASEGFSGDRRGETTQTETVIPLVLEERKDKKAA